uniref:O-acyltransferase n=1 Tax=Rhabditophanes sp. KR3021 TaxID=114890 RepID=A0AC35UA76_9BILA
MTTIDQKTSTNMVDVKNEMKFKVKEFIVRDSVLTENFKSEARILYNYFASLFILLAIGTWIKDIWKHGNPLHHTWLIWWNFNQLPITLFAWAVMHCSTIIFIYYGMSLWSKIPSKYVDYHTDKAYLASYIIYLVALFYLPIKWNLWMQLNPACSYIITCENTRLAMKVHSFVRENFKLAVKRKEKMYESSDSEIHGWPTIQQYNYFMFAPTFIYRNQYPQYPTRSWKMVANYTFQFFACIYIVNLMFIQFVYPQFSSMNYQENSIMDIIYSVFPSIIPGMVCLMMLFYGLLHCWLNIFAEAMQFGDRLFYASWWNSKNMAQYYRGD